MLVFPSWYEEPFVNVENLLIDMFTDLLPNYECGCWTPDDWLEAGNPVKPTIWFFRVPGGRVDWAGRKDECQVQVLVATDNRDDSWRLMNFVRAMLLPMQGDKYKMVDGSMAQIHRVEEVVGPQLLTPGQRVDTRVVAANFQISVSMKSAKNFKQHLYALWQSLRGA